MDGPAFPGKSPRRGISDLWNSGLYEGAAWSELDNPLVRCTAGDPPSAIMSWQKAKAVHKRMMAAKETDYHVGAFIHCYIDDQKFDGQREGIWSRWKSFYEVATHFDGILGVDFSVYADFPEPLKRYQFHKMRAIEHGAAYRGIPVVPNARWGTDETWGYCYDALPDESMLSIGVVGSGLNNIENRPMFDAGIRELVRRKQPTRLVVVGSDRYAVFDEIRSMGIDVVQFDGPTCSFFKSRGGRRCQSHLAGCSTGRREP